MVRVNVIFSNGVKSVASEKAAKILEDRGALKIVGPVEEPKREATPKAKKVTVKK